MLRYFIEPIMMLVGAVGAFALMYAGSYYYDKHRRQEKEENK